MDIITSYSASSLAAPPAPRPAPLFGLPCAWLSRPLQPEGWPPRRRALLQLVQEEGPLPEREQLRPTPLSEGPLKMAQPQLREGTPQRARPTLGGGPTARRALLPLVRGGRVRCQSGTSACHGGGCGALSHQGTKCWARLGPGQGLPVQLGEGRLQLRRQAATQGRVLLV